MAQPAKNIYTSPPQGHYYGPPLSSYALTDSSSELLNLETVNDSLSPSTMAPANGSAQGSQHIQPPAQTLQPPRHREEQSFSSSGTSSQSAMPSQANPHQAGGQLKDLEDQGGARPSPKLEQLGGNNERPQDTSLDSGNGSSIPRAQKGHESGAGHGSFATWSSKLGNNQASQLQPRTRTFPLSGSSIGAARVTKPGHHGYRRPTVDSGRIAAEAENALEREDSLRASETSRSSLDEPLPPAVTAVVESSPSGSVPRSLASSLRPEMEPRAVRMENAVPETLHKRRLTDEVVMAEPQVGKKLRQVASAQNMAGTRSQTAPATDAQPTLTLQNIDDPYRTHLFGPVPPQPATLSVFSDLPAHQPPPELAPVPTAPSLGMDYFPEKKEDLRRDFLVQRRWWANTKVRLERVFTRNRIFWAPKMNKAMTSYSLYETNKEDPKCYRADVEMMEKLIDEELVDFVGRKISAVGESIDKIWNDLQIMIDEAPDGQGPSNSLRMELIASHQKVLKIITVEYPAARGSVMKYFKSAYLRLFQYMVNREDREKQEHFLALWRPLHENLLRMMDLTDPGMNQHWHLPTEEELIEAGRFKFRATAVPS